MTVTSESIQVWRDVLGAGLVVIIDLALECTQRAAMADDVAARLLESIALLEDGGLAGARDDPPQTELQRLDAKLDLLLSLFSLILGENRSLFARVMLSAEGMVAPESQLADCQDRIALYPEERWRLPLILGFEPIRAEAGMLGIRWRVNHSALRDALERWVFRLHRRDVARQRLDIRVR